MEGHFEALGEPLNSRKKWGNFLIGLVVVYLALSGNRGLWNLYKLHQEKQNLSEQILHLKTEISGQQSECQVLEKNVSAVEKQAREELDLVKPGETVYKFTKNTSR